MVAVIEIKGQMTSTGVFHIIIGKLRNWQYFSPIILLEIEKGLKVDLHSTDLPLCLAISLWIKSGG